MVYFPTVKVSIVVPTFNEERLLPTLLESITSQDFSDYEVIVADAGSADSTAGIADSFGAKVVAGGLPARGRNIGATYAQGEYLFFFDADVVLPGGFLNQAAKELDERFLDLATCGIQPLSNHTLDRIVHKFINATVRTSVRLDPKAMGFCIFVTRRLFERAGGFDETIRIGEDAEFVKRAAKIRSLHWLSSVHIDVSVRRFEKEGRLRSIKKGIRLNLHRAFKGEVRDDIIEYEFAQYDSGPDESGGKLMKKIEDALLRIESRSSPENAELPDAVAGTLNEVTEDLKSLFKRRGRKRTNDKDQRNKI